MSRKLLLSAAGLLAFVSGMTAAEDNERSKVAVPLKAATEAASRRDGLQPSAEKVSAELAQRVAERSPRVLFITAKDCAACQRAVARLRKPGGDFESMAARGWRIGDGPENHLQIIDREQNPELVARLKLRELPAVVCVHDGEIVRSFKDGCTTPLDAWTFGFLLKGQNERPQSPIPEAARVATTGNYPLRGNHWSVEGVSDPTQPALIAHLRGPNHSQQIAENWAIESWSYEELRSLHDDLHERELANGGGVAYGIQSANRGVEQFSAGHKFFGR